MEWALIGLVSAAALFVLAKTRDVLALTNERRQSQMKTYQTKLNSIGFIQPPKETDDEHD